jgi:hypothetical protein
MTDALGLTVKRATRRRVTEGQPPAQHQLPVTATTTTTATSSNPSRPNLMFHAAMVGLNHRKRSPQQSQQTPHLCLTGDKEDTETDNDSNHNNNGTSSSNSSSIHNHDKPKQVTMHGRRSMLWRYCTRVQGWRQMLIVTTTIIVFVWGLWTLLLGNYHHLAYDLRILGLSSSSSSSTSSVLPSSAFLRIPTTSIAWGTHPRVITLRSEPSLHTTTFGKQHSASERKEEILLQSIMYENLPRMQHTVSPLASEDYIKGLQDSYEYGDVADPLETKECKAQYDWQLHSFPSCNHLHERELQSSILQPEMNQNQGQQPFVWVASGYWRDVWIIPRTPYDDHLILKTIRYDHDYTERNYDRHRRDALAMERLTDHPYIVDIYAFCGNSGIFEFAGGGDIGEVMFPEDSDDTDEQQMVIRPNNVSKLERLHIAVQVAMGLAAVHNSDKEGRSAIAHTDISPGQFVRVNGRFKLNDFNRARFLTTNITDGSLCPFYVGKNPGKYTTINTLSFSGYNGTSATNPQN